VFSNAIKAAYTTIFYKNGIIIALFNGRVKNRINGAYDGE
jgi:hypothetical protein